MQKNWIETLRKGNIGESFVRWHCQEYNISYKKATRDENLINGIDAFLDNIPNDIKNTPKIFLGKYSVKYGKFYARHPFRENSTVQNYCILDIKETEQSFKIKYNGPIAAYLTAKYLINIDSFSALKALMMHYDGKNYKDLGSSSINALMLQLKNKIKPLIKQEIYCNYDSYKEDKKADELAISLITYEDNKKV
jgi:hypothetical protein